MESLEGVEALAGKGVVLLFGRPQTTLCVVSSRVQALRMKGWSGVFSIYE